MPVLEASELFWALHLIVEVLGHAHVRAKRHAYEALCQANPPSPKPPADSKIAWAPPIYALTSFPHSDGFAEFLARSDVSLSSGGNGVPPFADFVLCASRPEREAPPPPVSNYMSQMRAMPAAGARSNVSSQGGFRLG